MFKSIQWKLVLLYLLLVVFIITIIGVVLLNQIEELYYDDFNRSMYTTFNATFSVDRNNFKLNNVPDLRYLTDLVNFYSGYFFIDGTDRNMYVLDELGIVKYVPQVIPGKDKDIGKQFTTVNVLRAISGQTGDVVNTKQANLDYAQPVITADNSKYIIYITDNKARIFNILNKIKSAILGSLLVSLLLSAIIGFLFARTLTIPIKNLADKAKKIAGGDFGQRIDVKSKDEIGQLTKDFNHMARALKNTLSEINNEKSKVEAILTFMADGVMAFDHSGKVIHINPAAKKIINIDYDSKSFDEIFSELNADISLGDIIYLNDDAVKERRTQINDNFIRMYFVSFRSEGGKIAGVIVVLQDVTEQEKLDKMRREFVADVSHELRTPLTTIKSYIETLIDGAVDERETAMQFLNVIDNETDRMTRLVKDLLQLSKIDYHQAGWKKELISLDDVVRDVINKINIEAKNKEQTLEYFKVSNVGEILADRDKIHQVLLNIISNAIKYTQEGGKINVYLGSMYNDAYVKVVDNGIGIPEEDLPRVFERFYRVDKARSRDSGGTGLGLAIAKEIIEAHGGNISISSKISNGTEVIISFPLAKEI